MGNESYYYNNEKYSSFLDNQDPDSFRKIADIIEKYSKGTNSILEVGCGSGVLLSLIDKNLEKFGVDISSNSIERCQEKKLKCLTYDGRVLPFVGNKFDIVFSYNVLEHVDNVRNFLSENLRVLESDGYLILVCPNFLSITNNFHWHTTGLKQKLKNISSLVRKIFTNNYNFDKMKTIDREDFHPDDDACNITNTIDIYKWSKENNLKIEYWSSQSIYKNSRLINFIDKTIFKIFFGACFFVFKKNNEKTN